jgi:hypothetical protein
MTLRYTYTSRATYYGCPLVEPVRPKAKEMRESAAPPRSRLAAAISVAPCRDLPLLKMRRRGSDRPVTSLLLVNVGHPRYSSCRSMEKHQSRRGRPGCRRGGNDQHGSIRDHYVVMTIVYMVIGTFSVHGCCDCDRCDHTRCVGDPR